MKAPFKERFKEHFNKFDADEKLEIIEDLLNSEIDFEYYTLTGVIESHFPLHKRRDIKAIQENFAKYKYKLIRSFLIGGFPYFAPWPHFDEAGRFKLYVAGTFYSFDKYMQPINMIKNYHGEKYAFEYCFLLHYVGWLAIPSFVGLLVIARMV